MKLPDSSHLLLYMESRRSQPHGSLALLHAGPVELLYYWFYRAPHDSTTTSSTLATILTTTLSSAELITCTRGGGGVMSAWRVRGATLDVAMLAWKYCGNTQLLWSPPHRGSCSPSIQCLHKKACPVLCFHSFNVGATDTSWRYNVNEDDPEWLLVAEASITSYCLTWLICILDRKLTDFHYTN
ncbi:hypothetical protein YC2023_112810 [Brassica napus]